MNAAGDITFVEFPQLVVKYKTVTNSGVEEKVLDSNVKGSIKEE